MKTSLLQREVIPPNVRQAGGPSQTVSDMTSPAPDLHQTRADDLGVEHEYRYLLSSPSARQLVDTVSKHLSLDVYDSSRPVAYSHTTYYDTPNQSCWLGELSGSGERVRVRQYASAATTTSQPIASSLAYLEFKRSADSFREKIRYSRPCAELRELLSRDSISPLPAQKLARELATQIRQGELSPVFSTWYRRISMSQESVRVTIDENVVFCQPSAIKNEGEGLNPPATCGRVSGRIVEIKHRGVIPHWLEKATERLSGAESVSKFQRGMKILLAPSGKGQYSSGNRGMTLAAANGDGRVLTAGI